jgi:hypothetical protein
MPHVAADRSRVPRGKVSGDRVRSADELKDEVLHSAVFNIVEHTRECVDQFGVRRGLMNLDRHHSLAVTVIEYGQHVDA